ncbi:MAG: carboxypeptidase regulatory-like domain-containing protein [Pyrinomonadaceae bacterium]|nr:carboxypeptidase regulatory-like domain-containing protein [Pyrinomonadaceae bacterium]
MSFAGGSFARSSRARRFISRHLTLWLMLWILGTVVLTSVLAGARDERKRSTAGLGQQRRSQSVVNVLNEKGGLQLKGNRNSDVRVGDRQRLVAELFMNPPASLPAAMLTVTSSATLRATPNNGNAEGNPGGIQEGSLQGNEQTVPARGDNVSLKPKEERLIKAHSFNGDLRDLPRRKPVKRERPELEGPEPNPTFYPSTPPTSVTTPSAGPRVPDLNAPAPAVPAPPPGIVFEGLDRENWGAGSPPDTNGDVGPTYYIQSVNTSVGIYRKSDGFREAAFTFDTLMSQGNFGNLCDTDNFGDPVVLYDTFDDRWILTDFAFLTDVGGNVLSPAYQCFAVSMNGNPLTGGWNFYSIPVADHLNDYPKLGVWTDGLYMSANLFSFGAGSSFQGVRVWAFNKAQMYAGSPTVKIVSFNLATGDFTVVPANARLQTGTPPPGRPNFFLSTWLFTNAVTVYKFHVDWNSTSLSTFTGPDVPIAATSWPNAAVANAPQPGTATLLDVLQIRAMVQSQYTNFGGTESLWVPHTVRRANTTGFAAPRWYQTNITGGTVALSLPQAATWDPDAANVIHRYMPSLALDRGGNMAMGYSTSNSTTEFPSLKYAGRLSTDPINTFGQTEQTLFSGTASQTGTSRWGDYSSMMLDPDGCTFWYTNEYANPVSQAFNMRWLTKIGSFKFAECTPVGAGGTVSGTVTDTATSNPINGATVALGGRTETTDISGAYTFLAIPAGTYPSITASFAGYGSSTATSIVVADAATTTQNFSLTAAPTAACLTDTTQADFLLGVFTGVDLNTSPGEVTLINLAIDQQNTAGTTTGTGFGTPAWTGQTFTSAVNGQLVAADIQLFCNGCGATPPNLTLSVRNTAAGLPTGVDLASVTIPGSAFASGASVTFTASFGSPATLTSGTQYALILRPVSVPTGSGYFWIRSSPSTYASGSRVLSADSGGTWSADTTRDYNFKTYMRGPYSPTSGNLVSNTRDANPSPGLTPIWSTLSWNASTPASTSLQFQLAGSNSVNGPFNFIGPDGTAATFFTTSPASLNQFYGLRYLQYKAFLSTTNSAVTPTLSDATICFADVDCSGTTPTITPAPAQVCENSTGNTASGPAGMTAYSWSITNGTITSSTTLQSVTYTAGASGNVMLTLTITTPSSCITANSLMVPINAIPAIPTITPGGPTTFCAGDSVTLTSSSASGNQWYLNGNPIGGATNQTYVATASGDYTNTVTTSGCTSAPSIATTVTVNPIPATPTITPGGPTTFCEGGSVTLTSSSASGNQWYLNGNPIGGATNQSYVATASGDYTNTVTTTGCTSTPSIATTVTVNPIPATPTITPGGPTTFCAGGSVTLTSSSASGNQWYLNGNPIGGATNQTYIATASGDYTNIVTTSGCSSASSAPTTVTVSAPSPVVTNTNDSGAGSLRQAIIDACDGGTITFDPGLSGQTITLTTGELVVNKSLTIQGLGANLLTVSGNNVSRVVNVTVAGPGIVTISGLTVANGAVSSADGGGIRNSSSGTINVSGSTVSNNSAVNGVGAGIVNLVSGTVNVISSTLSGNANADGGGGIYNDGTVNVINSTLSGNSASIGGGILNTGTVTVIDSTISDNSAINFGGGIFRTGGTVTLHNTIVAGNEQGVSNVPGDIGGPVDASSSFNLIGTGGSGGLINGVNNNQVGVADARLGPLSNNGGSTLTHALLSGSAALDTGSNALLPADTFDLDGDSNTAEPLPVDQRGAGSPRVQDAADADTTQTVDIGAFEARASAEDITDQSTLEDTPLSFGFNVGDVSMITSVTASSSNATLVPNLAANLSITGSGSSRTLNITPALNENTTASGTSTVTVMVTSGTESMTDTFVLTVTAVNDAPTFQIASNPPTITEDSGPQIVPGFATNFQPGPVTATDESGQTLVGYTVTLTGTSGSLSFAVNPNINNAGNLSYSVAADSSGTATFDVVATDTGSGTPPNVNQSAPVSFTITVDGVNDGPVNTNPGPQSVVENSTLTFSAANSNQISVSDTDVGTNPMQVTLTASDGTMTLASVAGLLFSVGDGTNDSTMTFGGMLPALNNALNGLTFHPTNGFNGVASLQILSNDQGFTGTGGAHSDNDVVNINVLDGGTLAFSSAAYMVSESGPVATITVNRSGGTNGEARIDYATSNGTATAGGTDYTTATGTLIFANGVTTQTFTVPINNDAIDEPDETVNLTLSNPQGSGALGSPSTAVLTITDDDATPSISIDDPAITEGNSGTVNLVFTVTLSGPSSQAVTVNYATGNNTATAPSDFVGIPSTLLTFNPLETSKQITVVVNGDNDFEPNEALEINLSSPSNATLADPQGLGFINNDDPPGGTFVFNSPTYFTTETLGSITITVNRTGTTTQAASVDYATSDMTASERSDYTTALGTLNFPIGATSATFKVLVNIDSFAEISEVVGLTLSNPSFGAALGTPSSATLLIDNIPNAALNTNDDPGAFVDQHYHDFLNREADGLGRQFWINQITGCGVDATCIEIKRINVSAAFFLSIEFQETGFTAFLTHRAAFGSVLPGYRPFERDTQALQRGFAFGLPGADVILEANKVAYFNEFVVRPEFITIYGSLTNAQYVDALIANTAVTFTTPERDALVNGLDSATETRATVLRTITEKGSFKQAQFNRAFVYMQYVGYLRRAPADPPDNNLDGFNFWLNKLNQFNGNFVDAEMVKAFILSTEYRQRFGL